MSVGHSNQNDKLLEAFSRGLNVAKENLESFIEINEGIQFSNESACVLSVNQLLARVDQTSTDACWMQVKNGDKFDGFSEIAFQAGDGKKITAEILKVDLESEQVPQEQAEVLSEIVNILINACLIDLSPAVHKSLTGSVPDAKFRAIESKLTLKEPTHKEYLLFESAFEIKSIRIKGRLAIAIENY